MTDTHPAHEPAPDEQTLAGVGERLRALRTDAARTLADVAAATGISVSTLSRLESGGRKPTLELLLPLARAYGVPLDDLVGAPAFGDPRVHIRPISRDDQTVLPLHHASSGIRAFKQIIPERRTPLGHRPRPPQQKAHAGQEWLYVLSGRLRLLLGPNEYVMGAGEAAEFDTRIPHWFGSAGPGPVEILSLFSPTGEQIHVTPLTRG